jgi:hypothetical protein
MSTSENSQLVNPKSYNPKKNMIFSDPVKGNIPNSPIEFKRILISTRNEDGTVGELIVPTERLFSFGISENTSPESSKITGYTMALCLYNRTGPTEQERAWVENHKRIVDNCIDHILDVRDEIDQFELKKSDLTKIKGGLDPLYLKRVKEKDENGKIVLRVENENNLMLYAKLIRGKGKIMSMFFNENDEPVDPMEYMGKYCYAKCAIKYESIFVGAKSISLQLKIYEAVVEPIGTGMKRLLSRPTPKSKVLAANANATSALDVMNHSDNEDNGSLLGDDDDENNEDAVVEQAEPVEEKPKKTVKRTVKRKTVTKKTS